MSRLFMEYFMQAQATADDTVAAASRATGTVTQTSTTWTYQRLPSNCVTTGATSRSSRTASAALTTRGTHACGSGAWLRTAPRGRG